MAASAPRVTCSRTRDACAVWAIRAGEAPYLAAASAAEWRTVIKGDLDRDGEFVMMTGEGRKALGGVATVRPLPWG